MMSIELIREIADEAAREAAELGLKPYVYWDEAEVERKLAEGGFPFPFLGDYVPYGWERVEQHFVDSSGFGTAGEPALSADQFVELVQARMREAHSLGETIGWAVVEAGQFQVYVGEYRKAYNGQGRSEAFHSLTIDVTEAEGGWV